MHTHFKSSRNYITHQENKYNRNMDVRTCISSVHSTLQWLNRGQQGRIGTRRTNMMFQNCKLISDFCCSLTDPTSDNMYFWKIFWTFFYHSASLLSDRPHYNTARSDWYISPQSTLTHSTQEYRFRKH